MLQIVNVLLTHLVSTARLSTLLATEKRILADLTAIIILM